MDRHILDKLIIWLRRKHPGTVVQMREFWMQYLYKAFGVVSVTGMLSARAFRVGEDVEDLGIISSHMVTDVLVNYLVDSLQSTEANWVNFKYHDSGTGVVAEAAGDTALGTPTGEARSVGTQIEGATANIYKSVVTHTYAGTFDITEHGLLNAASGGTLMDRSVFTAIGVLANDKIEWTYQLTCVSGG